jgi:pyruvate-formate lyase
MTGTRTEHLREMMLNVTHDEYRVRKKMSILNKGSGHESIMVRKALGFELILRKMPVFIQHGEIIVGSRTMFLPRREDTAVGGMKKNLDFVPDAETLDKRSPGFEFFPNYASEYEKEIGKPHNIDEGYVSSHCVAGYRRILRKGFGGIRAEAERKITQEKLSESQKNFLRSVVICMNASGYCIERYALEAELLAKKELNKERKGELTEIARVCRTITTNPPQTFHEALQLLFFAHIFTLIENYNLMALGRMDQYLYPFFRSDIDNGIITLQRARELLECFFIKLNDTSDLHTDNGQNIIVSGVLPDGNDGTNELTYLLLDVHSDLRLTDPQINIRIHQNSPEELLFKAFYVSTSGPKPMVYNDDAIIPALMAIGVLGEDARDYCIDACQDILVGEKSDFYPIFAGIYGCHLLTVLERVVERLNQFPTFGDFFSALLAELSSDVKVYVDKANEADSILPRLSPTPFLSATLEGCVDNGKDKTEGGTKYNFTGFVGGGIVNVINSIAAIKKLVYDQKVLTASQVMEAVKTDFNQIETIRRLMINTAPKWGNNDSYVDDLGVELARFFCDEVLKYMNPRGGKFVPGLFTHHQVRLGNKLRSTPDGRKRGEPLAISLSPTNGTALKGPTAAILSAAKIDQRRCPLGTSLDLTFQASIFKDPDSVSKFLSLVKTYFNKGGMEIQVNSIDVQILRDAQINPARHRDLVVRVWGFNAYFISLKREYQDELISRIEKV